LENMRFAIVGKMTKSKAVLTKEISKLGGKVVSKVDKQVAAVISTKGSSLEIACQYSRIFI